MKSFDRLRWYASKALTLFASGFLSLAIVHSAFAGLPEQKPLFLLSSVKPIIMLNLPKEQQLFFKLYNDYTNITNAAGNPMDDAGNAADAVIDISDTTYNNNYDYYGYFDSKKCYKYSTSNARFEPNSWRNSSRDCVGTDEWSGNFLNWGTMTRIDAIRKILYGGYRSQQDSTDGGTVLERAFLPNDAHSFAKFYRPAGASNNAIQTELKKVVPDVVADASGITLCNTTDATNRNDAGQAANSQALSQTSTAPPLMKVAKGDYSLWADNERWQCGWKNDPIGNNDLKNTTNGNVSAQSGISAATGNPNKANDGVDYGNYNVRVQVCKSSFVDADTDNNEKCKKYATNNIRPTGLLQQYGENDSLMFGLVTGSYSRNKTGGVLRKAVSSFTNEVESSTGKFLYPTNSIVKTLDKLRIYGYRYDDGTYFGVTNSDNCQWGWSSFDDMPTNNKATCTNWGNPQAEIYLESLRYLAGLGAASFNADDSGLIAGLTTVASPGANTTAARGVDWTDPIDTTDSGNYCAPLNVLQFNASVTSYDTDNLAGYTSAINMPASPAPTTLDAATDLIGTTEAISGNYFIGENGVSTTTNDPNGFQLCTAKTVSNLSALKGICSEAPRLQGGFGIAGLSYLARKYGLKDPSGAAHSREKVKTFGVALASALPKVEIVVPGSNPQKKVTIIPACRNKSIGGNCAIVDFKITPETTASGVTTGKLYVNWEDSEQGGDFDQDMWGVIDYNLSSTSLTVNARVVAKSTGDKMGFGYIISGTDNDGPKFNAGINGFDGGECTNCNVGDAPVAHPAYGVGTTAATSLQLPLYYAAKWGGWTDKSVNRVQTQLTDYEIKGTNPLDHGNASVPGQGTYYYAIEPKALETGLKNAFAQAANIVGSAATVAANSTSLQGDTQVFQARFDSAGWTGQLLAYELKTDATLGALKWSTDTTLTRPASPTDAASGVPSGRKVYSSDGASAVLLSTVDSLPALKDALKLSSESNYDNATKRFYWLLGSAYDETAAGGLRPRTKVLGDIINSDPGFAGKGTQRYDSLPAGVSGFGASSYNAYVTAALPTKSKANRKSAIFVGANDGMLHAFDATTGSSSAGTELFAYIPRGIIFSSNKLANLSSLTYTHQYAVDGPVYVSDAYINGNWRTLVTGTLGAGGRGAYALDVTDVLNGTATGPTVIFDISADDPSTAQPNAALKSSLGYSYSKMLVLPTAGGKWTALFSNGTNSGASTDGYAKFIAIDVGSPSNTTTGYKVIDTQAKFSNSPSANNDNGLSGAAFLPDATGVVTYAYAGDLLGNMWKFDLTNSSISSWKVAYDNGGSPATPLPLIKVIDSSGNGQPISAAPTLGRNNTVPSVMVYFGTGRYSESADISNSQVQSIYGISDAGANIPLTTANRTTTLHQKSINTTNSNSTSRVIDNDKNTGSTPAVTWTGSNAKKGWFLDFSTASGERVLSRPLLLFDRVILNTFIPSSNQCDFGGKGWLMELTGVGDLFGEHTVLGTLGNHVLDHPILGDLIPIGSGEKVVIIGSELGDIKTDSQLKTILGDAAPGTAGRLSWRQLK